MSSTFCSNPDALGVDESAKGIFDSLKRIVRLPPSPPKGNDRVLDSTTGTAGDLVIGEAGKESPAAGTGEWFDVVDWFFCRVSANVFCVFQTNRPRASRRILMLPRLLLSC